MTNQYFIFMKNLLIIGFISAFAFSFSSVSEQDNFLYNFNPTGSETAIETFVDDTNVAPSYSKGRCWIVNPDGSLTQGSACFYTGDDGCSYSTCSAESK